MKAMTRRDVIVKAMAGQLIWIQAADTLAHAAGGLVRRRPAASASERREFPYIVNRP